MGIENNGLYILKSKNGGDIDYLTSVGWMSDPFGALVMNRRDAEAIATREITRCKADDAEEDREVYVVPWPGHVLYTVENYETFVKELADAEQMIMLAGDDVDSDDGVSTMENAVAQILVNQREMMNALGVMLIDTDPTAKMTERDPEATSRVHEESVGKLFALMRAIDNMVMKRPVPNADKK